MSNVAEKLQLISRRRLLTNKKQTAEKRKRGVDKAADKVGDLNESKISTAISDAVYALTKGLVITPVAFNSTVDSRAMLMVGERAPLESESYRLVREIYKYQAEIDDIDYRLNNLRIEEG